MVNGIAYSREQFRQQRERAAAAAAAVANRTVVCAIMGWTPKPIAPAAVYVMSPLWRPQAALRQAA
jgi:hypothetical protein